MRVDGYIFTPCALKRKRHTTERTSVSISQEHNQLYLTKWKNRQKNVVAI